MKDNNYCTKCGNKLNTNDIKCSNCGLPVLDVYEPKPFNLGKFFLKIFIIIYIYSSINIYYNSYR